MAKNAQDRRQLTGGLKHPLERISGLRRVISAARLKRCGSSRRHARLPNAKDRRQRTGGLQSRYSVYGG